MSKFPRMLAVLGVALSVVTAAPAAADSDSGTASFSPWSGYWWPHKSGGLTEPLSKYDRLFAARAAEWEREVHARPDVPDWFGHCHAWSAASVTEKEPRGNRSLREVPFAVGDQKGLLSACHAMDVSNVYGDRFGDGQGSEDPADLQPDELWRLLQLYLKQRKLPLICDLEPGEQVWNYPISAYRVEYSDTGDGWYNGKLQLVVVENNVQPNFVGHRDGLHDFTFRFQMLEGAIQAGSGEWTGASISDHPDFAWYPYVAVAENPELEFEKVSEVMGYTVGGDNSPVDGTLPGDPATPPTEVPPPTNETPADREAPPRPVDQIAIDGLLSVNELVSVVANKTSHFTLDAFVDLGDGGRYQAGQAVRVSVRCSEPGYLYVFDIGPQGKLRLVFPWSGESNRINGDQPYDIPAKDGPARLLAEGNGQHELKVIVTSSQVRLTGFNDLPGQTDERKPGAPLKPQVRQGNSPASQDDVIGTPPEIRLYPAAKDRVQQQLTSYFRKGLKPEPAAIGKTGRFAQDQCSYFVLPRVSIKPK